MGWEFFDVINFANYLHMKLYNLLILNKIQTHTKIFKALKTTKLVMYIVMSTKLPQITTISDGMSKATTWLHQQPPPLIDLGTRWSGRVRPTAPMACWADDINIWPNGVLAFNHPLVNTLVCLGYCCILINIVIYIFRNVFENLKIWKNRNNYVWDTLLQ